MMLRLESPSIIEMTSGRSFAPSFFDSVAPKITYCITRGLVEVLVVHTSLLVRLDTLYRRLDIRHNSLSFVARRGIEPLLPG